VRKLGVIDIRKSPTDNLRAIAERKRARVEDLTAVILDRPRHAKLIEEVRAAGARIHLISDGDVAGALATVIVVALSAPVLDPRSGLTVAQPTSEVTTNGIVLTPLFQIVKVWLGALSVERTVLVRLVVDREICPPPAITKFNKVADVPLNTFKSTFLSVTPGMGTSPAYCQKRQVAQPSVLGLSVCGLGLAGQAAHHRSVVLIEESS
jgi:hypothetical protein